MLSISAADSPTPSTSPSDQRPTTPQPSTSTAAQKKTKTSTSTAAQQKPSTSTAAQQKPSTSTAAQKKKKKKKKKKKSKANRDCCDVHDVEVDMNGKENVTISHFPSDCTIEKFNAFNEKCNGRKFDFNVPGIVACTQIPYFPWTHVFSSLSEVVGLFNRSIGLPAPPQRGRGRYAQAIQRPRVDEETDLLATCKCKEKVTISH